MKEVLKSLKNNIIGCALIGDILLFVIGTFILVRFNANIETRVIFLCLCVIIFIICSIMAELRDHSLEAEIRRLKRYTKRHPKNAFKYINDKILPVLRAQIPPTIFKYYWLESVEETDTLEEEARKRGENEKRISAIEQQRIWSSLPIGFNDPFELKCMYLSELDIKNMSQPHEVKQWWELGMEIYLNRMTIASFTKNPNDMPMWAHYANNHKGFCVEYEVFDLNCMYPVIYIEKRLEGKRLFLDIMSWLSTSAGDTREEAEKNLRLFATLKHHSWQSENEIRVVILNADIVDKGKLISCEEAGVRIKKIYIGMSCSKENIDRLINLAELLHVEYELCGLSLGDGFSVINDC